MKKKILALGMAAALIAGMVPVTSAEAFAAAKTKTQTTCTADKTETTKKPAAKPAKAKKVKVSKATCTSAGKVNIKLAQNVSYSKDLAITITDSQENKATATITKKTKSLIVIDAKGLVKGEKYTVTIEGIKVKGTEIFTTATCSFTAKSIKTDVKAKKMTTKVKVQKKNNIVVTCNSSVNLAKEAEVVVKDADGNTYTSKIVKKSKGNVKVSVAGLEKGKTYTITITGIKTKKEVNYGSVSVTFTTKK